MRRAVAVVRVGVAWGIAFGALPSLAGAQEQPSPEQVRRMYDDALGQLKAAQDRRNELAARVRELEQKLAEQEKELSELRARADGWAERTFTLRATHAAWREFIDGAPEVSRQWEQYLGGAGAVDQVMGTNVLTFSGEPTTRPVTTQPTTAPTP
ncbi:MAG TPA: hypothetical protein VK324_10685 [Tepidisphaeraceae bacterium]|nr:hypothetical protein [Tepidisphaeraceae bacterium]